MSLSEFLQNLWRGQTALILAGGGFLILLIILAVVSIFDSQQILGINRWIKPMKFASSITIFLWTLAIYLQFLPSAFQKSKTVIAWGAILLMTGEIMIIVGQAARGTTSHFNVKNVFDGTLFAVMGLMIVINALLCMYLLFLYFRADFALPTAVIWGLRLGLILFLLANFEGGYMSAQLGHTVGAMDGGHGLPFLNWSVTDGDLRVAHFIGLHALQAIPLAALFFQFLREKFALPAPTVWTTVFALLYFSAFSLVFAQALLGKPLIKTESGAQIQNGKSYQS